LAIEFVESFAGDAASPAKLKAIEPEVMRAHGLLHSGRGAGNGFLGWLDLPVNYDKAEFAAIKAAAARITKSSEILIVIGIGGSYLGARAVIEFVKSQNYNALKKSAPAVYFAGNSVSGPALAELIELCEGRDFSINVISKSGTTTEPAVAFRVFRERLEQRYGKKEAAGRIFVTTDKARGALKTLADEQGYETFVVPDDIGGRYSVLTAVGLLPIAVAGVDIDELMRGAADAREEYLHPDLDKNACYRYAAIRNLLYRSGKKIEMIVSFEPSFTMMCEWFKQLFGESEGKDGKGIFPASAVFSTDLHSMGQYIQQGERILFETAVFIENPGDDVTVAYDPQNTDELNFLAGKTVTYINRKAFKGTVLAHVDGGVPNIVLKIPDRKEYSLGWLLYFFEKACGLSGYILGVNPFDQPGVEDYKRNMFALLGKRGYEELKSELEKRL